AEDVPANLKIMAEAMTRAMIAADPANSSFYAKNLRQVNEKLDQVNQDIVRILSPCRDSTFYVFHPAFGYFAHAYDLDQVAVELEGKSPSPRQLSALIKQARNDNVKIIFVQPEFDKKNAEAVASAIHGRVVPLDPLAEDVPANLKIMAEQIRAALSGNNI
ncbi:MAG: ABC transporter substrate-binding protein, partial [Desulfocapsa sp.]